MKKLIALLFNLLVASVVTFALSAPVIVGVAAVVVMSFVPGIVPQHAFGMALQKEIWEKDIVGNLFADDSFLSKAYNADMYVLSGKVVHVPQAGGKVSTKKNRADLPATVVKRNDTELTYALDEYTTDPRLIPDADKVELSYDKRNSVIAEDKASLKEAVANEFVYKWSPSVAGSILRTSGATIAAHLPDATGDRKAITLADVSKAAFTMNAADIPQEERYALLDSWMYKQLLDEMSANAQRDFLAGADPINGVIGKYAGFSFYQRSRGAKYSNAATPVPISWDAEGNADDNAAALFWQKNSVERAMGDVKAFDNPGDATFYGDILSFLVRAGGRIRRAAQTGVVAVVQTAVEAAPAAP